MDFAYLELLSATEFGYEAHILDHFGRMGGHH